MRNAHPAIFQPDMVRAILDGRKTMTRRLARTRSKAEPKIMRESPWARYKIGDLLWVRENYRIDDKNPRRPRVVYFADPESGALQNSLYKWRPSIHLPRKLSRLTLEIVSHKIERLQDISEEDAIAEGALAWAGPAAAPRAAFAALWSSIHGKEAWDENPELVAVGFKVHRKNVDEALRDLRHSDETASWRCKVCADTGFIKMPILPGELHNRTEPCPAPHHQRR
jgi:hypothetical protein